MAAGQNQPGGPTPPNKLAPVLVPVIGVGLIVVLVVVVAALNESPTNPTGKDKGKGGTGEPASLTSGPGRPMPHDGSNGGTDDPDLKPIGTEGLKYRDLKVGDGPECPKAASVEVHYVGWLPNGTEFDSSRKRGETITFPLNGVVQGWQEGIPRMKVGGVRKLVIPPALGYGQQRKGDIPPGSTLIFEVELVGIK